MTRQKLGKLAGFVVTMAVLVVGVAPATFEIPNSLRPWIFLISIVWVIVFSSGVLSS